MGTRGRNSSVSVSLGTSLWNKRWLECTRIGTDPVSLLLDGGEESFNALVTSSWSWKNTEETWPSCQLLFERSKWVISICVCMCAQSHMCIADMHILIRTYFRHTCTYIIIYTHIHTHTDSAPQNPLPHCISSPADWPFPLSPGLLPFRAEPWPTSSHHNFANVSSITNTSMIVLPRVLIWSWDMMVPHDSGSLLWLNFIGKGKWGGQGPSWGCFVFTFPLRSPIFPARTHNLQLITSKTPKALSSSWRRVPPIWGLHTPETRLGG